MNEAEKERILSLVAEGVIRPNEAAQLLAALAEDAPAKPQTAKVEKRPELEKAPTMEVQMQRADGSTYSIEVPTNLMPMFLSLAGAAIKESARTAAIEAWAGMKTAVRTKAGEVRDTVKAKVTGTGGKPFEPVKPAPSEAQIQAQEARQRILQMVQNGRITAEDAGKLIQQLDALHEYQKGR